MAFRTVVAAASASLLLAHIAAAAQVARSYELVLGPGDATQREVQLRMCQHALKNLNALKYEPPMTCRRPFDPTHSFLKVPTWRVLGDDEALVAALAWERNWAEAGPPSEVESRYSKTSSRVRELATAGELKAWQATLELVNNGESVRVVLLNYGRHKFEGQCFYETKLGVFVQDRFEVDKRYSGLSIAGGEVILHDEIAYIADWTAFPSATLFNRAGPRKNHRAYLLISAPYWLKEGVGGPPGGIAGRGDVVCQIGYQRIGRRQDRKSQ